MTRTAPLTLSITQAYGLKFVLATFVLVALTITPIALLTLADLTPGGQVIVALSGSLTLGSFLLMGWLIYDTPY